MQQTVMISRQFNGPPKSANGGYASGLVASGLNQTAYAGAIEVSLHVPPPLDKDLTLSIDGEACVLMDGTIKVGTARPAVLSLEVPPLPEAPILVGKPYNPSGKFEPFDVCFVCGNARAHGDGLCLHAERVQGHPGLVVAPWDIHASFLGIDGNVADTFIWSALDCPGYFACAYGEAALLARFTTQQMMPLTGGQKAYVYGWSLDHADSAPGRKRRCGTAIVAENGTLIAKAEALWIIVDPAKITV